MNCHSRVASSVHITSAHSPSVTVHRHRQSMKYGSAAPAASVFTNESLRQGGMLPFIMPDNEISELTEDSSQPKQRGCSRESNKQISQRSARPKNRLNGNTPAAIKMVSGLHSEEVPHLENSVEKLTEQLTRVELLLQTQNEGEANRTHAIQEWQLEGLPSSDDTEVTEKVAETRDCSFSLKDYVSIIIEMNDNIPLEPYDPSDFTEPTIQVYQE